MISYHSGNFPHLSHRLISFSVTFCLFTSITFIIFKKKSKLKCLTPTSLSKYSCSSLLTCIAKLKIFNRICCLFPLSLQLAPMMLSLYHPSNTILNDVTKDFHAAEFNSQFAVLLALSIPAKFDITEVSGHTSVSSAVPSTP